MSVYRISLTRGYFAFVSAIDYERINAFNWHANVNQYQVRAARMKNRRMIYMHHQVLNIMPWELNGLEIDHIDRDPLNSQRENLRVVTHAENMANSTRAVRRRGYCFNRIANLWSVYIDRPGQRRRYLGYTKTKEEAILRLEAFYGENN